MKILLIGGNGEIGKILKFVFVKNYEIILFGRNSGDLWIDLLDINLIKKLFKEIKNIDVCICVVGDCFIGDLFLFDEEKLNIGIKNKLFG